LCSERRAAAGTAAPRGLRAQAIGEFAVTTGERLYLEVDVLGGPAGSDLAGNGAGSRTCAHNITAAYSGTATSAASTSAALIQVVTKTPCASLAGCNLSGLNLTGARLAGVNLTGANLNKANLNKANLTGADLTGATVTGANFNKVTWADTACPDGTNSNADGGTCVGHL
jgi:uncharacterized protein YjbI with pentapeptide repeats